jgi:uncharacterized protein YcbK (DUF882 family)
LKFVLPIAVIIALAVASSTARAGKPRRHKVKQGEVIAQIARFHGVEQDDLREANGLNKDDEIHPGDVLEIPDVLIDGWLKGHIIRKGDTLARIAKKYRVSIAEIKETNRLGPKGFLKVGRRLAIPKGKKAYYSPSEGGTAEQVTKKERWNGKATFVRVRDSERKTMTMFGKKGRVRTYARRTISRLGRSKKGKVRILHPRLIKLLGKVAEQYPGQDIVVVSGYRPHKRGRLRSQHSRGKAMDFRVRGVANIDLYRYLKTFDKVGVGYYPNSSFVHFDVRDKKYLWTDVSAKGEPARYLPAGSPGTAENLTEELDTDAAGGEIDTAAGADPENFDEELDN